MATKKRPKSRKSKPKEKKRSFIRHCGRLVTRVALALIVLSMLLVLPLRWINPLTSSYMLQASWIDGLVVAQQWRNTNDLPWTIKLAVLSAEDQQFPEHYGFDIDAIKQAVIDSQEGNGLRGASTITQQVARNLYLWPGKTAVTRWLRKGGEAWLTLWMEMLLSKQRILEIYLNIAELGPGVYGVEAASRHYFSSSSAQLSQPQAAALASMLPSPKKYSLFQPSDRQRQRREWIQKQMRQLGSEGFIQKHQL